MTRTATSLHDKIAHHVAALPPSGIRRFFELVLATEGVISLGVGEPDFQTPWTIREEAIYQLERGRTTYTSNYGLRELRVELSKWLGEHYGLRYDPDREIVITVGGSEAIDIALRAILNPGEEVIVVEPCYVSYAPTVALAGGVPVSCPTYQRNGFRLDFDELQALITPRTKALIVNYPNNPTGATLRRPDLERLATVAADYDLLVLSDEIYAELTYEGAHVSLGALPGMKERTLLVSGFSKAFAMTGWRIGYLCGPEELISAMVKIHQYTILCAPTISQFAALEALRDASEDTLAMRAEYERRRNFIVNAFNELGLTTLMPEGAFYAFANIQSTGLSSEEFCTQLLHAQKVAVVPGTAFGACGEGFIRASYATAFEKLEQAVERVARFLGK
ncbi:MAG: aminotransferase class I/II-fold pyridoxal phosphate-dependent enzyme [Candidatus Hydrogenedentota bacterium]|jgi:aminotransferase|uniref:Aminotransferase n=1 Tax=Sumerlaea chitinivorans TaxID=2250252 RepID=A0A2Z4Y2C0_SUMC1|nr:Aspartate aminotransferase [Candidatus Sumerlaea chitinivorans]RMH23799.1 MAG: aminotransferase class I/II-fold pyridoxal phosphate-dependent enzyme [Candidatus Hydrogenedentota bacterium]